MKSIILECFIQSVKKKTSVGTHLPLVVGLGVGEWGQLKTSWDIPDKFVG